MLKKKENLGLLRVKGAILQKVWELEPCAAPTVQEALQGEKNGPIHRQDHDGQDG